jgi:dinuclear metal center YbgI/SA1388 family protein
MRQNDVVAYCNQLLNISSLKDFCPNGMQVEGDNREVKKIALGVSISLEFIEKAIELNADLILTHHGLIWDKDSRRIQGPIRKKLKALFESGIAAGTYHLPLDFHPELGNNVQLAKVLELSDVEMLSTVPDRAEAVLGTIPCNTISEFSDLIEQKLQRKPLILPFGRKEVSRVVIITGGAQGYYLTAVENGADCFLTGEASEKNYGMAQEYEQHFISAGHYATEKWGILALGEHLKNGHDIPFEFIEIENPL